MELGIQIGGVLLTLMFLVFLILGRKSWKWFHMVMMFLVMAMTITVCIYAAMANKTRRAWAERFQKERDAFEKLDEESFTVKQGDPAQKTDEDSLVHLRGELWRATHDMSKVYRKCVAPAFDGTSPVVVSIPRPPAAVPPTLPGETPAEPAPAAPAQLHTIAVTSTVYVFVERQLPDGGDTYPLDYVGEFHVAAATEDTVTLTPTLPPLQPYAPDGVSTWAIYEEIPTDRHQYVDELRDPAVLSVISRLARQDFNPGDEAAVQENKRILEAIFPADRLGMTADSQEYKDFIDSFRFDGWAITQINQVRAAEGNPPFDPPAIEQWVKIEFVEPEGGAPEAEPIEVDSPEVEIVAVNWSDLILSVRDVIDKLSVPEANKAPLRQRAQNLDAKAKDLAGRLDGLRKSARDGGISTMSELVAAHGDEFASYTQTANELRGDLAALLNDALGDAATADAKLADLIALHTQVPEVYDDRGRAIRYDLKKGEPVKISLEDRDQLRRGEIWEAVFDNFRVETFANNPNQREIPGTADNYIADGQGKLIERIYKRKLNDFRYHVRNIYDINRELQIEMKELNEEIADMQEAVDNFNQQSMMREEEQTKLNEDLNKFTEQKDKAQTYADELEQKLNGKIANIEKLLAEIDGYETRLAAINAKKEEAVRRTAQSISADAP